MQASLILTCLAFLACTQQGLTMEASRDDEELARRVAKALKDNPQRGCKHKFSSISSASPCGASPGSWFARTHSHDFFFKPRSVGPSSGQAMPHWRVFVMPEKVGRVKEGHVETGFHNVKKVVDTPKK